MSSAPRTPGGNSQHVWRNTLTLLGAWIAGASLLFILSLLWFDLITPRPSPYLGLFTFLIFPAIMLVGIVLALIGLWLRRRRMRRLFGPLSKFRYYPRFDFNVPAQRRGLAITLGVAVFTLLLVGAMSYEGYHYTDSNQFCGAVCHTVMEPQYTAHQHSAHARVDCAACHIGEGASWYVKSKLSGLRQVLAVATDSFPRPIPPAIRELRPAAETCEQCHWPEKFYGDQLVTKHRFANDEHSTPRTVRMLVKTGGSDPTAGPTSGIHWHMALSQDIEFIAVDEALQDIPWVRVVDHVTGAVRIYRSDGRTSSDPPPPGIRRVMDCMDCHNRATHVFRSPADAADSLLNANPELRTVPFAKRQLVSAVMRGYESREAGLTRSGEDLKAYYRENHSGMDAKQEAALDSLAAAAREIYRINFFPLMNVTWKSYPNNIGHFESPGCFRCHAGDHEDDAGRTITSSCETCHEFMVPASDDGRSLVRSNEFVHPFELEGIHAELTCERCHSGGVLPEPTCEGCHAEISEFRAGTSPHFEEFGIEADSMDGLVGCEDCHDVAQRVKLDSVQAACLDCHDEGEYGGMVKAWRRDLNAKLTSVRSRDPRVRNLIERLLDAGALHNPPAAHKILDALAAGPAT